jgi:hypothetical protein
MGGQAATSEYGVKAAFVYHFAQFVEWPDAAFPGAKSPLVYCTVGFDPFRGALERALQDKNVGGAAFRCGICGRRRRHRGATCCSPARTRNGKRR